MFQAVGTNLARASRCSMMQLKTLPSVNALTVRRFSSVSPTSSNLTCSWASSSILKSDTTLRKYHTAQSLNQVFSFNPVLSSRVLISNASWTRRFDQRFVTTTSTANEKDSQQENTSDNSQNVAEELPPPNKSVGYWLLACSGMVFLMVVVGGITRLTESGLSIVEWKPITGAIPPRTEEEWAIEFQKYTSTPEFKRMNSNMTVEEFKNIFFWEYVHRLWGRTIGAAFILPFAYFTLRGKIKAGSPLFKKCFGMLLGIGAQGALGWYMVKSGLEEPEDNSVPRVSPYRLASHLSAAVALYVVMAWVGLGLISPRYSTKTLRIIDAHRNKVRKLVHMSLGLTGFTMLSGAFVAGRDAGFIYNSFPKMGDDWVPEEAYNLTPFWKNFFENDASVQLHHRILAMTTLAAIIGTWAVSRGRLRRPVDKQARMALHAFLAAGMGQVALGIITLLAVVPVTLGAAHQTGSMTLMTVGLWLLHQLKRLPK